MLKFTVSLILAVSLFAMPVAGYEDVSELPVDNLVTPLVEPMLKAFNSGDAKQVKAFIEANYSEEYLAQFPLDYHIERFTLVNKVLGELNFHSVRQYGGPPKKTELPVVFKTSQSGIWYGAIITVTSMPPHKISDAFLIPARAPSNVPKPVSLTFNEALVELDGFIELMADLKLFSGNVLLAKDEKILFSKSKGFASKRFNALNNLETKFNLGSMNKMFSSLGVLQLVEAGKLSLSDKLSKFADETWLSKDISDKIEVRHLLTHSSGLGNYFNKTYVQSSKNNFRILEDYKVLIDENELLFEPGTNNRYSNTGTLMLGVIIEAVSGQDYFSYLRENLFKPAGMHNTDSYEMDEPVANLAIGYDRDPFTTTGWRNNLYTHVLKGGPAGGGFSTVEDLHRYALALTNYELLGKELTEEALSPKPELHSPRYGYCFGVRETPQGDIVGHGGAFMGISSNLDIFREQGYIAVVLSNYSNGARHIEEKMRELVSRLDSRL